VEEGLLLCPGGQQNPSWLVCATARQQCRNAKECAYPDP